MMVPRDTHETRAFVGPLSLADDARVQRRARVGLEGCEGPVTLAAWRAAERDVRWMLAAERDVAGRQG